MQKIILNKIVELETEIEENCFFLEKLTLY